MIFTNPKLSDYKIKRLFEVILIEEAFDDFAKEKVRLRREGILIPDFDLLIGATSLSRELEVYFEQRSDQLMQQKLEGKRMITYLYKRQQGLCPICRQKITEQTGWNAHHKEL